MKKRKFAILGVIVLLFCLLSSCGTDDTLDKPSFSYSMNFYQEEFEEEYSEYEKVLDVAEDSSEISITGQTSSGKIDIQIISTEGENKNYYNYEIEGVTEKTITLGEEHSLKWSAIVKCYKDTEGSFEISVK